MALSTNNNDTFSNPPKNSNQGATHQVPVVHNGIKAWRHRVSAKGLDQESQLTQAFLSGGKTRFSISMAPKEA